MKIILIIVVFIIVAFILLWLNAIRGKGKVLRILDEKIQPAIKAVTENQPSAKDIIYNSAKSIETRNHLYAWLKSQGKEDLFPMEYRGIERIAESDFACWLMHPNELKALPSKIELMRVIPVQKEGRKGSYYLFRFQMDNSHWRSKDGWMAGAAGAYWDNENAKDIITAKWTFSEYVPYDSLTEEQHFELLKKTVKKWGFVVPT
jgi:hypothetical protein